MITTSAVAQGEFLGRRVLFVSCVAPGGSGAVGWCGSLPSNTNSATALILIRFVCSLVRTSLHPLAMQARVGRWIEKLATRPDGTGLRALTSNCDFIVRARLRLGLCQPESSLTVAGCAFAPRDLARGGRQCSSSFLVRQGAALSAAAA